MDVPAGNCQAIADSAAEDFAREGQPAERIGMRAVPSFAVPSAVPPAAVPPSVVDQSTAIEAVLGRARRALRTAPPIGHQAYPAFARALGARLIRQWPQIERANAEDLRRGRRRGLAEPLLHRIGLQSVHRDRLVALTDAVPVELDRAVRPGEPCHGVGGSRASRVPRPLGVLLMIYEARPTVTVDSTVLGVCAGNAVLLRGGSEIVETNAALAAVIEDALAEAELPAGLAQVLVDLDRAGLRELLRRDDAVDVLLPRGSPSLVDSCRAISRIPMIVGGGGVNHQYVHADADLDLAVRLVLDGKLPEPEGCTALEAVLLDQPVVEPFCRLLPRLVGSAPAVPGSGGVLELRAGPEAAAALAGPSAELNGDRPAVRVRPLAPADLGREFLGPTLAVLAVDGLAGAVGHIDRYGSRHTESIVTQDPAVADEFCRLVDAAAVVVNGSVRLHDGPTLGLGSEMAISTGRLHVRGPVTVADLMSHSWRVDGNGAVRFGTQAGVPAGGSREDR
jgi:glutamate-5-semialdehyde dehydrogenase